MKRFVLGLLAATAMTATAHAETPAIVYDLGGKFDKSFNEAAYNGAEQFKEETGTDYVEFEIQNEAQREQALRRFAERGHSPVIIAGFSAAQAVEKVAQEFPETNFAIIDMVVDDPEAMRPYFMNIASDEALVNRLVSPGHFAQASMPILPPRPLTGLAKSR